MSKKLTSLFAFSVLLLLASNICAADYNVTTTVTGAGIDGVLITLSPGYLYTGTTGADGKCTVSHFQANPVIVIPQKAGYTFSPAFRTVNLNQNRTAAFTASTTTNKAISGVVGILDGVTLTGLPGTVTTGSNGTGMFSGTIPSGWSGTVTPTLSGYTFNPASRTYNSVTVSQIAQNFVPNLNITGTTTVGGVTLTIVKDGITVPSVDSNEAGAYAITVQDGDLNIVITPTKAGYVFTPVSTTFPAPHVHKTANFTPKVLISGTISNISGPLEGVTLSGMPGSPVTNASGAYTATVDYNWSGTATPTREGYGFTPATREYSSVITPLSGQDYTPGVGDVKAFNPSPAEGSKYVRTPVLLGWTLGDAVLSQDIYIGTDFDEVDNADDSSELCVQSDYVGNTYTPTLANETLYYWRIDGNYASGTLKGDVWNFTTANSTPLDPNLIGWWGFDEEDSVAWDQTGKGHNGTMSNTTFVDGKHGKAMNFVKASASYVDLPAAAFTPLTSQVTVALWTFGSDLMPYGSSTFNGMAGTTGNNRVLNAHIPWYSSSTASVIVDFGNTGGTYDRVSGITVTQSAPSDHAITEYKGKWNHWAITKDVTLGQIKVYCNGVLAKSGSGFTKPITGIGRFRIGQNADGSSATQCYDGMIDDFQVYNKALSELEIRGLAENKGAFNFSPANNTVIQTSSVLLDWDSPATNPVYNVYLSTSLAAVDNMDANALLEHNLSDSSYTATGLSLNSTYYWAVDVNEGGTMYLADTIMSFKTATPYATNPSPVDTEKYVASSKLSWTVSGIMINQDVYFGTDQPLVTAGDSSVRVATDITDSNFTVGALTPGMTYYWKVVTSSTEGDNSQGVWSFTAANAITDPNLIGSWEFEEPEITSKVLDSSGYSHGGTFHGNAAIVADPCGVRGNVLWLDGAGDYISLGSDAWTNPGNHMSISVWFNVDVFDASYQTIFAKGLYTYRLGRGSGNKLQIFMDYDTNHSYKDAESTTNVHVGWHQAVVTYNGTTMKLYIDKVLQSTAALSTLNADNAPLMIGRNSDSTGRDWQGWIDDVRFYNRVLSDAEIGNAVPSNYVPANAAITEPNILLDWDCAVEGALFNVYFDTNSVNVTNRTAGCLVSSNQIQSSYLTGDLAFDTTYYWAVDANVAGQIFKTINVRNFKTGSGNATVPVPANGGMYIAATQLSWTPSPIMTSQAIYFGTSSELVAAKDASVFKGNTTATSYTLTEPVVDGVTYYWMVDTTTSAGNSTLGVWSFTGGEITDVNLVGWWKFNEPASARDYSGYGHNGTFVGSASIVDDGGTNVLSLNGTTDYVNMIGYKGVLGSVNRTVCAWIKTSENNGSTIVSWGANSATQKWHLKVDNTSSVIRQGVSGGYITGTTEVNDGNWHHIATVWANDGSPDVAETKIYIDGIQEATGAFNSNTVNTTSGIDVAVGLYSAESDYFGGMIKDVRIYNKALTQQEIWGIGGFNPPLDNLQSVVDNWLTSGPSGDMNVDGIVDLRDFNAAAQQW